MLFRKKPLLNWYLATALAITGLVLINGSSTSGINIYLFFPLLGGFCYAGYVTFSAALPEDVPQEVLMMLIMSASALVLLPVMWFVLFSWTYSSLRGVSVSLGLGIVTGGMAFTLFMWPSVHICHRGFHLVPGRANGRPLPRLLFIKRTVHAHRFHRSAPDS